MPDERQRGPWTQDKGDKEALAVIKKMREGREGEDDAAEGMREFVELCRLRYGGEGQQAGEHIEETQALNTHTLSDRGFSHRRTGMTLYDYTGEVPFISES